MPAFSKVIEKLIAVQVIQYLKDTNYFDNLQSAYKHYHRTITALLNVTEDIYECLENSELVFLVLLDYSKAFDCANHKGCWFQRGLIYGSFLISVEELKK